MPMTPPPGLKIPPPSEPTKHFGPEIRHRSDVIASLALSRGWTRGAELGVAEGKNAERILRKCPNLHLVVVDLWEPQKQNKGPENWADWPHDQHEAAAHARLSRFSGRVDIIKGLTIDAAQAVPDNALDFVFIDADHSEAGVRTDIRCWLPKIKPGGTLLGHDAAWPGVRAAIDDLCPGYWIGPNDVWGLEVKGTK